MSDDGSQDPVAETGKFLWEVHRYTNEYIRFADTKAAFIAGVSTALIGGLVGSSLFDSCFRTKLCLWTGIQWAGVFGLFSLVASLGLSVAAIRPRLWNNASVGFIFWGSIKGHRTARNFTHAVQGLSTLERTAAISDHLFVLAGIADRKYAYVDRALFAGVIGGALTGTVLFMQHAWR